MPTICKLSLTLPGLVLAAAVAAADDGCAAAGIAAIEVDIRF